MNPWSLHYLRILRDRTRLGKSLAYCAQATNHTAAECDVALWALMGRSEIEALAILNGDLPEPDPEPAPASDHTPGAARRIALEVAQAHGLTLRDLAGPSRKRRVVLARQEAFWRIRMETNKSLPVIGRVFGGRDHTTVIHGIRAHEQRLIG